MRKKRWLVIFFVVLVLVGCSSEIPPGSVLVTETFAPSFTSKSSPSPPPTQTNTFTPTVTPTHTFTPEPTNTPTETSTPWPTPIPIVVVDVDFANVYTGIAIYLPVSAGFTRDTSLIVLGITPDKNWLLVEIAPGQSGWIQYGDIMFSNPGVPVNQIDAPTPPTITPTPVAPPRISVRDGRTLDFYNFKANEGIRGSVFKNGKLLKTFSISAGEKGFATISLGSSGGFKTGVTYQIIAIGNQGSYAEKTFTP